ncbi:MAG: hypothetical protein U0768_19120 [Anaerolineae bacterium]
MAFTYKNSKGKTYHLHSRTTETASGKRTLYFFSGEAGEGAIDKVPEGYEVSETATGLPVLKKQTAAPKPAPKAAKAK